MTDKTYRTFVVRRDIDHELRNQAKAAGVTVSRYIAVLVEDHMSLDQQILTKVTKMARALGVQPFKVINNLIKTRLGEIEERKRQHDPAALVLDEIIELGA